MPKPKDKQYLTTTQVRARYGGRSTMWIARKLKTDPTFPRPVKLGGRWLFFVLDELEAWERARAAERAA
jgi:predicted DNA-binding transcriptional regulator AlpA